MCEVKSNRHVKSAHGVDIFNKFEFLTTVWFQLKKIMHQIRLRRQHHKNKKFLNQVIHLDFANDAVPYNAHSKVIYYFVERVRRRRKKTNCLAF